MFFCIKYGRRKIIFIWEGLIAKRLHVCEDRTSETICLEIAMAKRKWWATFAYRLPYKWLKENGVQLLLTDHHINVKKMAFFKELNQSLTLQENMTMSVLSDISIQIF